MPLRHPIFGLIVAALIGLCFGARPSAAQTDVIGQWSLVTPLPYFPVHTHMLPTGKVMIWPGDGGVSGNDPRSWDPDNPNQSVTSLTPPGYDIFCSGHSFLADGRLFVAGGHNMSNQVGLSRASTYSPLDNTWTTNLPPMNAGRWYPTTTVLANGDVLVVSGSIDLTIGVNTLPQVFQVATGTWRDLTGAQLQQSLYPWMLLAPNGRVFHAGHADTTRYLNTSGTGAWSVVGTRVGGIRDFGSAVMYAPGKVLVMGGGDPPKNTAEVIDLNAASPSWRAVGSMQVGRRQINATLLPDSKVLVTGGSSAPGFSEPSGHVDPAELWDPVTENWTTLASSSGIPRVYHSTALLLPDGRVLSTGGNGHPETEIYSPSYLFKGTRPTITSVPASVAYGQSFFVETQNALAISKITMLRLSSVTHAFNQSQYINELSFSQTTGGLNVTAPSAPTAIGPPPVVAPPGPYLLFILNGSGVPSVARIIQLGGTAPPSDTTPPTVFLTAPTSGATVSGTAVTVAATASDNVGVAGVQFKLDGANLGAEDTTSLYSVAWNSTTASNGSHTLTAVARDAAGNMGTSAGVTVTANNPPVSTITIGETSILSVNDCCNANKLVAQPATLSQTATIQSLSFYVLTASGSLRLGIYDASGPSGRPGAKKAETDSITPTTGWNTANVITPVSLPAGTYWLAYLANSSSLRFKAERTGGNSKLYTFPFGTMPATFSTTPGSTVWRWSLYATLTPNTSDATPPTVSITAPANGATVSGTAVTVSAIASDNVGVAGVQFKVDGTNLGAEDTASPYSVAWNSTAATNGSHTLTAVARDAAGNSATAASVSVTANNAAPDPTPPTVSITAPANGATVSGTAVTVSATASDNVGVAGVQFKVDGTNLGAEDTASPYSVAWNTTAATNGSHTLTAVARDAGGNTTTSTEVTVTVNNTGPTLPDVIVTSLSYASGVFTSTVKNQGTAATPAGIAIGVGYAVDGVHRTWGAVANPPLAAGQSATVGTNGGPYTIPNGTHTIRAYVDDVNRFAESDETNNQLSQPITVP